MRSIRLDPLVKEGFLEARLLSNNKNLLGGTYGFRMGTKRTWIEGS